MSQAPRPSYSVEQYVSSAEATRIASHESHRLARVGANPEAFDLFLEVHRRYYPMLHPGLRGPVQRFVELVSSLWGDRLALNPNVSNAAQKGLALAGLASYVVTEYPWARADTVASDERIAFGTAFGDPEQISNPRVKPIFIADSSERLQIFDCLWYISAILATAETEPFNPGLGPERLVCWLHLERFSGGSLVSTKRRITANLAYQSFNFRHESAKKIFAFDLSNFYTSEKSTAPLNNSFSGMKSIAGVGSGEESMRTRVAYFIGKIMAFIQDGEAVSLLILRAISL